MRFIALHDIYSLKYFEGVSKWYFLANLVTRNKKEILQHK